MMVVMRMLVLALAACAEPSADMQSGSRLRLIRYELADGSQAIDRRVFHDAQRGEDCTIQLFSSGVRHCMPTTAGGSTVFTEDSCTAVLGASTGTEPPPYFIRSFELNSVSLPSRLYRPSAPVETPQLLWEQRAGYCLGPFPPDPAVTFYAVGEEIAADELVAIRVRDTRTEGRITLAFDESGDGWRMPGALTDSVAGSCDLEPTANAAVARCLPPLRATLFGDNGCTQPLAQSEVAAHRDLGSGCWSLLETGVAFTGTPYERIGESCVAVSSNDALYIPAATRDPAELPRIRGSANSRLASIELGTLLRDAVSYDSILDADCGIEERDGTYVCAPASRLTPLTFFSDTACTAVIDVAFVPTGTCEPPDRFAGRRPIGAVYPGTIYELTTGDRCAAYVPPTRFAVHTLGAELPDAALVSAVRVVD